MSSKPDEKELFHQAAISNQSGEEMIMCHQYQMLIMTEECAGPTCQRTFDEDERLEVRELSTRVITKVRTQEISLYRHALIIDGRAYQILNLVRTH